MRQCLRRNQPGPYQIQAAIQAVHGDAPSASDTAWPQVVALYDQLMSLAPTPVVALNRAVAVAEVDGPAAGLALVDGLELPRLQLFHAVRAELLRRLGRDADAIAAYDAAIARTASTAERTFLERRRSSLAGDDELAGGLSAPSPRSDSPGEWRSRGASRGHPIHREHGRHHAGP